VGLEGNGCDGGGGLAWQPCLDWLAGGCSYEHAIGVDHYTVFKVDPPRNRTVTVCHAYGCREKTKFTFTQSDIAEIKKLMEKTKKADTPHEERRAIAYAIGWMERRTGEVIGTKHDRPGMDFPVQAIRPSRTVWMRLLTPPVISPSCRTRAC